MFIKTTVPVSKKWHSKFFLCYPHCSNMELPSQNNCFSIHCHARNSKTYILYSHDMGCLARRKLDVLCDLFHIRGVAFLVCHYLRLENAFEEQHDWGATYLVLSLVYAVVSHVSASSRCNLNAVQGLRSNLSLEQGSRRNRIGVQSSCMVQCDSGAGLEVSSDCDAE